MGVDLDDLAGVADGADFVPGCDATDPETVDLALGRAVRAFWGIDALVVNAGVFPPPQPLADLSDDTWAETLSVTLGGALAVLRAAHPFLRHSPVGGTVVVVASRSSRPRARARGPTRPRRRR